MDWIWKSLLLVIVGVIFLHVAGRATIESNELIGYMSSCFTRNRLRWPISR